MLETISLLKEELDKRSQNGCDIHVFSEYRELRYNYNKNREVIIGDKWISADFYQKIFNKKLKSLNIF
jgi:hypothetical protein